MPNHLVNKDIIHSNHQILIKLQCTDKVLDNFQFNQVMVNLRYSQDMDSHQSGNSQFNQVTGNHPFSQVMDSHLFSQDTDNHLFSQVMDSHLFSQVMDSHLFSQVMDSHLFSQVTVNLHNKCMEIPQIKDLVSQWVQDMVNLQCNNQVFLQFNLIQDNNMDNNLNSGIKDTIINITDIKDNIKLQYKAIKKKRIVQRTTQWNGAIKTLIQELTEYPVIHAEEILRLPIGSITVTHANKICVKIVENLE